MQMYIYVIIKISNICKYCNDLLFYMAELNFSDCLSFIKTNHCSSIVAYIYIMIVKTTDIHIILW